MTTSQASGDRREEEQLLACDQCGTRHDPGQAFCDICNAVLRWSPETEAPTRSGQAADGKAATSTSGTGPRAAAAASGTSAAPPGDGTARAASAEPASEPAPEPGSAAAPPDTANGGTSNTAGERAEDTVQVPDADAATDRARALLVPVADPQAQPDRPPSVSPVLPGRPSPARPEVRAPGEPEPVGGIACRWCETANRPDRHFCCRCAMPMATDPDNSAPRPWWRRLLDYRNREEPWAGDRPRLRRQLGRVLRWVVGAAALALVVTGLSHVGQGVDAVRDHFAKRAPIAPDSVKASRSYPDHGPDKAFDEISNSWWGPGVSQSGEGEWLEARFQQPVRLLDIGITPGQSTHADMLSKSALPHRIEARITTDDGKITTKELTLDQASGFQRRSFRFQNVTAVRFTLRSAYGAGAKKQVSIAEIEFFGPSQGGIS